VAAQFSSGNVSFLNGQSRKVMLGSHNKGDDCGKYVYEKAATLLTMNFTYCFICFSNLYKGSLSNGFEAFLYDTLNVGLFDKMENTYTC
jgi:hypothetical protein